MRKRLLAFLSLDRFHRKSALNSLIRDMKRKGAPDEFVSAMAGFLDDEVAAEAKAFLEKE